MVTEFGFARDWRFNTQRDVFREKGCDWRCVHTEYIEPLGAIAPSGVTSPQDMDLSDWTAGYNAKFRQIYVSGNPVVKWIEYYDGSVYTPATDPDDRTGILSAKTSQVGRWALRMVRFAPPPEQGVAAYVTVSMSAARLEGGVAVETGILSLVLPLHNSEYDRPLLHVVWGDPGDLGLYDVFTTGTILSTAERGATMQQGESRETWLFEYEEDPSMYDGSHILIRSPEQLGENTWWYVRAPNIQILDADLSIIVAGHVCALNLTPITYSWDANSMWADADQARPLPNADGWASTTTWGTVASCPDSWDVTASIPEGITEHRPRLRFISGYGDGDTTSRPVCWFIYEEAPATISADDTTEWDTSDYHKLQYISWEWDARYRGCTGSARFAPFTDDSEPLDWLRDNALIEMYLGWQPGAGDDLERQLVATGYIMPSRERLRDGEEAAGQPQLTFEIGDFAAARLPQKQCMDLRQMGGMTIEEFIEMAANRLGLGIHCWVDPAIENQVIPLGDPPSRPNFEPLDGDSWETLFSNVEQACNIRIGFDQDGYLFADTGPEEYVHGESAIVFRLDEESTTPGDEVYRISHTTSTEEFRNVLKAIAGKDDNRTEYYWAEPVDDREAGIGDDWNVVLVDDETDTAGGIGNLEQQFLNRFYKRSDMIEWVGPARPTLRPDDFVAITKAENIDVPDGAVYQILSHHIEADALAFRATSTIRAVLVWINSEA